MTNFTRLAICAFSIAAVCTGCAPPAREASGPVQTDPMHPAPGQLTVVSIQELPPPARTETVVLEWDFSLPHTAFANCGFDPATRPTDVPGAVRYTTRKSGSGPVFRELALQADEFDQVNAVLSVTRLKAGEETPDKPSQLRLYWARPADIKGTEWPFHNKRSVAFEPVAGVDNAWMALPASHKDWNGAISQLYIAVDVDEKALESSKELFYVYFNRVQVVDSGIAADETAEAPAVANAEPAPSPEAGAASSKGPRKESET